MCKWGDTVNLKVPIPANCSHTGKFHWATKSVDECIAPIVKALNDAGIHTGGSCCGHGKADGNISFHNGTLLIVKQNHFKPEEAPC